MGQSINLAEIVEENTTSNGNIETNKEIPIASRSTTTVAQRLHDGDGRAGGTKGLQAFPVTL
jgi:hypothetical protein